MPHTIYMATNLKAYMSSYGYPVAEFDPMVIAISRRNVWVRAIIWDAEYAHYRADGMYMRKDGTVGNRIAKPIMFEHEVPATIANALQEFI